MWIGKIHLFKEFSVIAKSFILKNIFLIWDWEFLPEPLIPPFHFSSPKMYRLNVSSSATKYLKATNLLRLIFKSYFWKEPCSRTSLRDHISYMLVHLDKKMGLLWSPTGNVKSKNISTSLSLINGRGIFHLKNKNSKSIFK